MPEVKVPTVSYRKGVGFQINWFPLFKLFPVSLKTTKFIKQKTIIWSLTPSFSGTINDYVDVDFMLDPNSHRLFTSRTPSED